MTDAVRLTARGRAVRDTLAGLLIVACTVLAPTLERALNTMWS